MQLTAQVTSLMAERDQAIASVETLREASLKTEDLHRREMDDTLEQLQELEKDKEAFENAANNRRVLELEKAELQRLLDEQSTKLEAAVKGAKASQTQYREALQQAEARVLQLAMLVQPSSHF